MCANREECLRRAGFAMFPAHKLMNVEFVLMLRMAALNVNIQQPAGAIPMFPLRLPVFALRPPDAVGLASLAPVMDRL